MRELKFRAWDKDAAKYTDGVGELYVDILEVGTKTYRIEQMCPGRYIIELFTGLKDKNGKEIYEGDIVRRSFKVDRNSELTYTTDAVKWNSYDEEEWPYSTISGFTLPESEDGYEVIGNIHENPELVKEELSDEDKAAADKAGEEEEE